MNKNVLNNNDSELKNEKDNNQIRKYLMRVDSLWFWTVIVTIFSFYLFVRLSEFIPELIVLRYLFGTVLALFIPGYTLVKLLYYDSDIETIERITLSIGLSLFITPTTSFILNYTPWGITFSSLSITISLVSVILASLGLYRRYLAQG